jgi:hypothetical protein
MSQKQTPEKMLLRLIRVAELLAKAEATSLEQADSTQGLENKAEKAQEVSAKNTKR